MNIEEKAKEIVKRLTLAEKASLCSGADTWHTEAVERLNIPSAMVADGPHGLRKQIGRTDNMGINISAPATCFPPAATTANSFNRELLNEIGVAIGEEAAAAQVSVVLGPGVNIKRSPLCGRNFEYFSEDPYLAGELGAAIVCGIQSQGIGTSLKHFAGNNQEKFRMISNSAIDERALREIYLSAFEKVVKTAKPWTIMCSYNKVNGTFASENKQLLTDILRDEWGFDGVVVSDWSAVNDRVLGVAAGLDLEMPASGGFNDRLIARAVKRGGLSEEALDQTAERLVKLVLKSQENLKSSFTFNVESHHKLARKAQAESAVLLKNDGDILPLKSSDKVAVIGEFAKENPRYQGAGSSRINPIKIDNTYDELVKLGVDAVYCSGKDADEVNRVAANADTVLIFAGLPDEYESEGFDRTSLNLPDAHNAMIEAAIAANPNVVVVLQCGAPVAMPWNNRVRGILLAYLGGQAGGGGVADILTGTVNPSGKLAETFPLSIEDTPCFGNFSNDDLSVEYRESIYVGYRHYNTLNKPVAYPFGYGLSYTSFDYSDFSANSTSAKVTVANNGKIAGSEVVQLYVSGPKSSRVYRAVHELKGFQKVFLQPGESREVTFALEARAFEYFNRRTNAWTTEGGEYTVSFGASSRDIRGAVAVKIAGDVDYAETLNFDEIYGAKLPPKRRNLGEPFDANCTLDDIKGKRIGRLMRKIVAKKSDVMFSNPDNNNDDGFKRMAEATQMETPLRAFGMMSDGLLPPARLDGLLLIMNGKSLRGMLKMFRSI
ncbi:MAG: glycoside hydrolase family 3 C-terminal domain-containing protein [Oscillospiraceae bacterium]|jgi:beta-glucosidase|nr:glycoside hydrolase family 3 C-terminal domain-containing protein [Oscillospiraceae bacterium]